MNTLVGNIPASGVKTVVNNMTIAPGVSESGVEPAQQNQHEG